MAAIYAISCADSIIEVRVKGTPDRESIARMWKDIVAACREHQCLSILGLSDMEQPIKLADAIDHQAIFLEAGVTIDLRIAWVQMNPAAVRMNLLVASVLLNRGLANGRVFTNEMEARNWLANR
jgi:hypothetical protein